MTDVNPDKDSVFEVTPVGAFKTGDGKLHTTRDVAADHELTRLAQALSKHYSSDMVRGLIELGPVLTKLLQEKGAL